MLELQEERGLSLFIKQVMYKLAIAACAGIPVAASSLGRQFVKVSASWGQKGLVSWSLSNFIRRRWTDSLTGTVVNSHSTSKDSMICHEVSH